MMAEQPGESRARRLEAAAQPLLVRAEGLNEDQLYRSSSGDEWTPMQILAHVAEMLPYWSQQAREVAARQRDDQPFGRTHADPDRIGAVEQHANDRLADVLPRIHAGLAETLTTLRAIPADGWRRTAHHANRGEMSLEQIIDFFLLEHLEDHGKQLEAALGG
jgi:hypothetical protein